MKNQVQFSEVQGQKQWWFWASLGGIDALFLYGFYRQIIQGIPFGDNPMSDSGLVIALALSVFVTLFFLFVKLQTFIDSEGVYFRYFPFQLKYKYFGWNEIESAYVRKYSPMKEYGGWGFRQRFKIFGYMLALLKIKPLPPNFSKDVAYTVSGDMGLQLALKNKNQKILIGTQKPEELEQVLKESGKLTEEK